LNGFSSAELAQFARDGFVIARGFVPNAICESMKALARRDLAAEAQPLEYEAQVRYPGAPASIDAPGGRTVRRLMRALTTQIGKAGAVIVGDYGKGVVTQPLLDEIKSLCHARGIWLSVDPKPVHHLNLNGLSLITPNRKEAFELAGLPEGARRDGDPLEDPALLLVVEKLLAELQPALLLITLGEQGMLLCQRGHKPFHIPTVAQEVFDVSGAGDTVIASFTLAIAAGASPIEAAIFSNHAAGVVVGKVGTATVTPAELLASFEREKR